MRRSSSFVAVVVAFVMCLAFASPALAFMEVGPTDPTSTYNPALGDDVYWRWQWGNTLDPDITFTTIPADTAEQLQAMGFVGAVDGRTQTTGFIYEVRQLDRNGSMGVVPALVPGVSPSAGRNVLGTFQGQLKTLLVGSFDIRALVNQYGWQSDSSHPGGVQQGEGLWGGPYLFFNQFRTENPPARRIPYLGVDVTAPSAVRNLQPSSAAPVSPKGWTENRRLNMVWTRPTGIADNYDQLSGVGGYSIGMDGSEIAFVTNTAPDPTFEPYAGYINSRTPTASPLPPQVANATIESLPGGQHTIGVTTVDRATNRSNAASLVTRVDYDTPLARFEWTTSRPAWNLGGSATISVNATDRAGISSVRFYVDKYNPAKPNANFIGWGSSKGRDIYSLTRSFNGVSNGNHKFIAVVNDMIGRDPIAGSGPYWIVPHSTVISKTFRVDHTAPTASVTAPSSKRIVTVKVRKLSEAATMVIAIDGQSFPAVNAAKNGSYTKSIQVAARPNGARTRKVYWAVTLTDVLGNARKYSGSSTVTYWSLNKISNGQVQLVVY